MGIWVFECTSIQRQFKTKWEVDAIVTVFLLLIVIFKNNDNNTNKIKTVMKDETVAILGIII